MFAAARLLHIKDLKVLIFFLSAFSIDMQVLTDLKRFLHGRGACPSPSHRAHERSRGTGPRATGPERVFLLRRSGLGEPELQTRGLQIVKIVKIVKILLISC